MKSTSADPYCMPAPGVFGSSSILRDAGGALVKLGSTGTKSESTLASTARQRCRRQSACFKYVATRISGIIFEAFGRRRGRYQDGISPGQASTRRPRLAAHAQPAALLPAACRGKWPTVVIGAEIFAPGPQYHAQALIWGTGGEPRMINGPDKISPTTMAG